MATEFRLNHVRLAFPDLFVAKDYQDNKKFRYSATALIVPGSDNDKKVWAAINAEMKAVFKDKAEQFLAAWKTNPQKCCYTTGDLKPYDGFKGMMALAMHRYAKQGRPGVFDKNLAPLTEADPRPYAGCYINVRGEIWGQDGKNAGIRGSIISLQFSGDGDAFAAGTQPSEADFTAIEDGTAEEPLG